MILCSTAGVLEGKRKEVRPNGWVFLVGVLNKLRVYRHIVAKQHRLFSWFWFWFLLYLIFFFCRDFPSTFQGVHGKIIYTLTVSIKRPWHVSKDFLTELNFVSRLNPNQPQLWVSGLWPRGPLTPLFFLFSAWHSFFLDTARPVRLKCVLISHRFILNSATYKEGRVVFFLSGFVSLTKWSMFLHLWDVTFTTTKKTLNILCNSDEHLLISKLYSGLRRLNVDV